MSVTLWFFFFFFFYNPHNPKTLQIDFSDLKQNFSVHQPTSMLTWDSSSVSDLRSFRMSRGRRNYVVKFNVLPEGRQSCCNGHDQDIIVKAAKWCRCGSRGAVEKIWNIYIYITAGKGQRNITLQIQRWIWKKNPIESGFDFTDNISACHHVGVAVTCGLHQPLYNPQTTPSEDSLTLY